MLQPDAASAYTPAALPAQKVQGEAEHVLPSPGWTLQVPLEGASAGPGVGAPEGTLEVTVGHCASFSPGRQARHLQGAGRVSGGAAKQGELLTAATGDCRRRQQIS